MFTEVPGTTIRQQFQPPRIQEMLLPGRAGEGKARELPIASNRSSVFLPSVDSRLIITLM